MVVVAQALYRRLIQTQQKLIIIVLLLPPLFAAFRYNDTYQHIFILKLSLLPFPFSLTRERVEE